MKIATPRQRPRHAARGIDRRNAGAPGGLREIAKIRPLALHLRRYRLRSRRPDNGA